MQNYEQAAAYIHALTGDAENEVWFRVIHDTQKDIPAHKYYGSLRNLWNTLCSYNAQGWGIFVNINAFAANATTHNLADVWYIRTHVIDLDNLITAQANYTMASNSNPPPSFAVQSSPGKYHVYWPVVPYQGNERYDTLQRKLRQIYDGDKAVIDPTRVLRLPGFYHMKVPQTPHMVTCWALAGYGQLSDVAQLEAATAHVAVIEGGGGRNDLGNPEQAAPSLDWLRFGLSLIDPNELDRGEWISTTAAFKQAGWTLADEQTLFNIWSEWCARYASNDAGENLKNWNSIRNTEVGWNSLKRRAPALLAYEKFGFKDRAAPAPQAIQAAQPVQSHAYSVPPPTPTGVDTSSDILSEHECKEWFKDCFFVERLGLMLTPRGRFMNATQFNGAFGGKLFVITTEGKTTDEPWKAALRSTLWTVPKVDHIRFCPLEPRFAILEDQLGRKGINTYLPVTIKRRQGDVSPFLKHMELMFPVSTDRDIIYLYLAHNVKFPGFKIPWAPMIQSAEGVGKGFLIKIIERIIGDMYVYRPKAEELVKSGSTFNSWQRGKLMIIVDEIMVDEKRELIEILKPLITEERAEIQSKGVDQEMEDNPANWVFFSNYKNAIPVNQNGRRYSIFFSVIQYKSDLLARGMDDAYFTALFNWMENGGSEIVADWLLNYPIEMGQIPRTAPETSSQAEAVRVSRGPVEIAIQNAIEDQLTGFRGGYVSTIAVLNRLRQLGGRLPAVATVERILSSLGYYDVGRAPRAYAQESAAEKTTVFAILREMSAAGYGKAQGYE